MLRALTTFHANDRLVVDGQEVDSTDPIVKGREHLFETVPAEKPTPRKAVAKKAKPADG